MSPVQKPAPAPRDEAPAATEPWVSDWRCGNCGAPGPGHDTASPECSDYQPVAAISPAPQGDAGEREAMANAMAAGVLRDVIAALFTLPGFQHEPGNSIAQDVHDFAAALREPAAAPPVDGSEWTAPSAWTWVHPTVGFREWRWGSDRPPEADDPHWRGYVFSPLFADAAPVDGRVRALVEDFRERAMHAATQDARLHLRACADDLAAALAGAPQPDPAP